MGEMSWPSKRTAFLVIHGVGEQNPFETLDTFGRGLVRSLEAKGYRNIQLSHGLMPQETPEARWATNYLRFTAGGNADTAIDCYEYYWAHLTQRQISQQEVFDWLIQVGGLARKYYDENKELVKTYEGARGKGTPFQRSLVERKVLRIREGRFDKYWYVKRLYGDSLVGKADQYWFLKWAVLLLWAARAFWWLTGAASELPLPLWIRQAVKGARIPLVWLARLLERPMVDGVGDIAVYAAVEMKNKHFEVRKRILDGATDSLEWLLLQPQYGQVVVAGHSLGSVIAYDAVNRLNNRVNAGLVPAGAAAKLRGLITFGSPLDKFAYFFRIRVPDERYIMRQILDQHVGFRCKEWNAGGGEGRSRPLFWELLVRLRDFVFGLFGRKLAQPQPVPKVVVQSKVEDYLKETIWINFWASKDPISGRLDFYKIAESREEFMKAGKSNPSAPEARGYNHQMDTEGKWRWGWHAHSEYWQADEIHAQIFQDVLT